MNPRQPARSAASLASILGVLALCGFAAGCAGNATHDSTGQYVDDTAVTTRVKAELLKDEAVKSFEIGVETMKGVVQLSGFVDNSDQKKAAGRDAGSVEGVLDVRNNLIVK
jgi:osmotically-inducible protein OsmY